MCPQPSRYRSPSREREREREFTRVLSRSARATMWRLSKDRLSISCPPTRDRSPHACLQYPTREFSRRRWSVPNTVTTSSIVWICCVGLLDSRFVNRLVFFCFFFGIHHLSRGYKTLQVERIDSQLGLGFPASTIWTIKSVLKSHRTRAS